MKVLNQTLIDDDVLKAMCSIVLKGYTRHVGQVIFKYTRKTELGGWCKYGNPHATLSVMIGKNVKYPFIKNSCLGEYFPRYEVRDQIELILAILAHEFAHLRFRIRGTKNTQVRAEKYAKKVLTHFREKYWNG